MNKEKDEVTYNQYSFDNKRNLEQEDGINTLIEKNNLVLSFLKAYLEAGDQVEQKSYTYVPLFNIWVKIRFNLEAIIQILPTLIEDSRFKTSINLLYRAVVDDIINFLYLTGCIYPDDSEQRTLENELNVLLKESLIGFNELVKAENIIQEKYQEGFSRMDNDFHKLLIAYPEVYDQASGKFRKNKDIRKTSVFPTGVAAPGKGDGFISENQKIIFIASLAYPDPQVLTSLFKYFSQYQHYSPKIHDLLLSDAIYDIGQYEETFVLLLDTLSMATRILLVKDNERMKLEFDEMVKDQSGKLWTKHIFSLSGT